MELLSTWHGMASAIRRLMAARRQFLKIEITFEELQMKKIAIAASALAFILGAGLVQAGGDAKKEAVAARPARTRSRVTR